MFVKRLDQLRERVAFSRFPELLISKQSEGSFDCPIFKPCLDDNPFANVDSDRAKDCRASVHESLDQVGCHRAQSSIHRGLFSGVAGATPRC